MADQPAIYITNKLVMSPHFSAILSEYTEEYRSKNGKVNEKKFYEQAVKPRVEGYSLHSFYQFLRKYKDANGMVILEKMHSTLPVKIEQPLSREGAAQDLQTSMLSVAEAEQKGIALALNIAFDKLKTLAEDPTKISFKDAADMLFKSMKARDSRIHAIGKVREDNREEEKLNRAFESAAF